MERFKRLTSENWDDFEILFEKHKGVRGGCWCSFYLATAGQYAQLDREARKKFHRSALEKSGSTGGLYYIDDVAVAWCQFGPRNLLMRYLRNRMMAELDVSDEQLWRISCIFVDKHHRKSGYARKVVEASIEEMIRAGATVIESFPFDFENRPSSFQHNGSIAFYEDLGFQVIGRIGKNEVMMRKSIAV